ncbi:hypothetical protein PTTG_02907 [Puccinia triticina 1-1 BBBD Race 1]|uniref:Uncharacterized protein n=1 Tax=Puccinia triticina (isolate 1-1 / race 1 (BBBD)) TaxID=630390 RepID=A0A180GWQ0_PUCT1|nr:hypothetical protein PTTG_02907 [Puccinia triticina 1-1 BBBD Race 1]WAR61766.1 hypothetical protein PtB15_12B456 [Puccinia triticina]
MATSTTHNATASQTIATINASASALAASQAALASASAAVSGNSPSSSPAYYKIIGIVLALVSGLFIGSSFVFKKKGLLVSQQKVLEKGGEAGESHAYLKSPMWWSGMSLMIVGEICNFVAYAFADAILVTPMGALSVVISAVLSSIFLKERLSFFGKVGCFLCVLGATIIAVNGPKDQAVSTIPEFERLFLAPGFLVFASIIVVSALLLIFVAAPRWGKTNMLVYISICSIIGGLSVVATQGLGASIITTIRGESQFKYWFMYFLIGFVVCTLLTEINYLNKALELYNTAMVTPTYYVMFTFSTLLTSIILFQGLKAPVADIITLVLGFLVICCGITLLQMSKVDPMEFAGLDPKSAVFLAADKEADTESGLGAEEPGVDGLRGFGGLIGSIHRNTLIARQSTVSSLAAQSERNSVRRRRQESYLKSFQQRNPEIGMTGMKRHTLWDRPVSDEILEDPSQINSPQGSVSEHEKRRKGLKNKCSGESVAAVDRRHSQSSNHVASHPGSLRSEKISTAQPNTANPPGESESDSKIIESSSRKGQPISTAGIGHAKGLSTLCEHPTGGGPGEPSSSNWSSSPILQSTSPLVRPRQGTTDSQNPLSLMKSGLQNSRSSSTTTGPASGYERTSHKSKERHLIAGKKKIEYDQTELQSLVGPSRSSSISSSLSCSSDLSQSFGIAEQTNPIEDSTGQIRIVATHPQLSEPPPHLDVVHHYPTSDSRPHHHQRQRHAPDDPLNNPN